ncbi:hypothetical protein NP174_23235, partial [Salmonella enterica]|nr:hypothetical protein [Salmonella enterica]
IILTLWVLKLVLRLVGPWLMAFVAKRLIRKAGFGDAFGQATEGARQTDSGSTTGTVKGDKWWKPDEVILKPRRRQGQSVSDILGGEYVDFQQTNS